MDKVNVRIQPVEISAIMNQVRSEATNKAAAGVIVNCVLGAKTLTMNTDPAILKSVLSTFIDNAAKFTSKGSINFGFDVSDDELYFYVKDTGIGVPRNVQNDLFEENDSNADSSLIKAMNMISALGGEIGVESRGSGKGSTFWFTLPYTPSDEEATAEAAEESQAEVAVAALPHKHTILIAEDNESNYSLFRSLLESRYNLFRAHNGQEAVDLFKSHSNVIDLILMDISMPIMDGYEATRAIRTISAIVPIVAVTAYAFTTDKQRIYENGFNAYVSKPISINRLERIINSFLNPGA